MEGVSASLASAGVTSYDTYVNLLCCDSDTDDDGLQSALLASFHQEESVSQSIKSAKWGFSYDFIPSDALSISIVVQWKSLD